MPALAVIGAVAAVVGAGAAVVGTIGSMDNASKQQASQQQAATYQRSMDNNRAARERVQAIRSARLSAGQATQAGANQGVSSSSASLGGVGSIVSQLDSNLSFLDTQSKLSDQASEAIGRASRYGAASAVWGSVAHLGMTVFDSAGGVGAIKRGLGPSPNAGA